MSFKGFLLKFKKDELEVQIPLFKLPLSEWTVLALSTIISIVSYIVFLNLHLAVAYNDARAHMNMARLVYDNLKPGFAQIGSVWLPLDHILKLALVWNDTLWQTGFAGSIWSMISFVGTSLFIYLLIKKALKDRTTAFLGAFLFMGNINAIYMQSTPMTELLLLLFFTATTYYLYLWSQSKKINHLIIASFWVFLATLTRYDGWFLLVLSTMFIIFVTVKKFFTDKRKNNNVNFKKYFALLEGRVIIFCVAAFFGIALWLLWNFIIFGDPLYFATGPYSAKSQQDRIAADGALFTKHSIYYSLLSYWYAMVDNVGFLLMLVSVTGLILFYIKNKISDGSVAVSTLLSPFFFHVISLFVGFSVLVTPEIGVELTKQANTSWFNVRYGLMILPAVAFFAAYLVRKEPILKFALFILIILQFTVFYTSKNVITITDGVIGTSSLDVEDVRDWLKKNASNDKGLILTSISYNNALAFSTGIPLKRFIHEGTGKYWSESLLDPTNHARWIVMANGDVGDPVYTTLVNEKSNRFMHFYDLKMKGKHTNIYERKQTNNKIVWRDGSNLKIGNKPFKFVGVNSYDLAYRTDEEIDETMRTAKENGINVIRFWAFGDGIDYGFQSEPGKYNKEMINRVGYIVRSAEKYDIKMIITLSNYWKDYGGVPQYLEWENLPNENPSDLDKFFTNPKVIDVYKRYVREVVSQKNPTTGKTLSESPAILAWELMNEPRSSTVTKGKIVTDWASHVSDYINSIDSNHIVSAGAEGFSDEYNDNNNGPSISEISSLENIEFSTGHYYLGESKRNPELVLSEWAKVARSKKKPFVIEEIGFHKDTEKNNGEKREDLVKEVFKLAKENNINGIIFWNWALKLDDSFGISPEDPNDKELLELIKDYSDSLKN